MPIQMTNLARLVAYIETKEAIENKDDAKVTARAMHSVAQGQLELRDAEKRQAHKMRDIASTVQVVQQAVSVAQEVGGVKNEVDNATKGPEGADGSQGKDMQVQPRQIGERAKLAPKKKMSAAEKKEALADAIKAKVKSEMLSHLQQGAMERLEYAAAQAEKRAGRHEGLAGEIRAVGAQVRNDAYANLSEIRAIETEDFTKQRENG